MEFLKCQTRRAGWEGESFSSVVITRCPSRYCRERLKQHSHKSQTNHCCDVLPVCRYAVRGFFFLSLAVNAGMGPPPQLNTSCNIWVKFYRVALLNFTVSFPCFTTTATAQMDFFWKLDNIFFFGAEQFAPTTRPLEAVGKKTPLFEKAPCSGKRTSLTAN